MFRANKRHRQPTLISNINELPEKRRQRLEQSWAGTFRREFFSRLNEDAFAVLYSDAPSRPNVPANVLVSLDIRKAGYGWSDEELYDHFLYDLQVRYAVGYDSLTEGQEGQRSRGFALAAHFSGAWGAVLRLIFPPLAAYRLRFSC